MAQMQDMAQRMSRIHDRAHQLSVQMQRQSQEQARMTDRERLMQQSCDALAATAQQMQWLTERAREMQRDRDMLRDQDMQRDMERLHQHLRAMATDMEGSLETMERMQQRIHKPAP
jgi:hypothetical protein